MRRLVPGAIAGLVAAVLTAGPAGADIKIGTIYDQTGPFAAGGSKAAATCNKIAVDMVNEKSGIEGLLALFII
jgi:branched-chain amino acid transport system substrate-binding protein